MLWGLCETINQQTEHQAELIKLPSRENNFWNLVDSYYAFYSLDLSHFDAVICTKYPAWMVNHKNLIHYVTHRLRGLYDTYHFCKLPVTVERGNAYINPILTYMDQNPIPESLDIFFDMLFSLKINLTDIPSSYFDFPGPFIRSVIHYLDNYGMSKNAPSTFHCISATVKNRKKYFPARANVKVVYPPSFIKDYRTGGYRHIFFVSRLDQPKRVDMLIESMKYVTGDIKLYIAGTGPQESALKSQAAGDKRIVFLGFINDNEITDYYADSLVIPYFPYDEDYGLITIEAMMHKKPVITTTDAGGPTEFVINNQTGFCVSFDPRAIGEKIDYFVKNPDEAARMGQNAYEKVRGITWESTVSQLLGNPISAKTYTAPVSTPLSKHGKRITVVTTYPIFPPLGGGQARIYYLYKNIANPHDVEIISLTNTDQRSFDGFIAERLREVRIPKTPEHQQKEWEMFESRAQVPASDIAVLTLSDLTPAYGEQIEASMAHSDIVVISHPYAFNVVKKYLRNQLVVYEAQDVAYLIKKEILPDSRTTQEWLKMVYAAEKECCTISDWIMTCSGEDRQAIHDLYGVCLDKIIVVPNGVDCLSIPFIGTNERIAYKERLGLGHERIGVFMGSWHLPNLEACERIFEMAKECPNVKFLLMGSQCQYFKDKIIPENVGMLGVVTQEQKEAIFRGADFALNPMLSGSGTNLKMFEYMASGIPIITTAFGARGIDGDGLFHVADIEDMAVIIRNFNIKENRIMTENARRIVEQAFDWQIIAGEVLKRIEF